uniref:CCR4-NOT transcription complex subunit 4 n=1 Tax=Tetraselmis sp. GSL018 TaxID=582737 RepID=A0A061SJX7_9CHLO
MLEDEEEETCPLCMEPLDVTDQAASLCTCGYSMCLWCWHHIMEDAAKENLPGRCPNCREPYDKEKIISATVDPDKIEAAKQKKKEEKKKGKVATDRKSLANVRVIQRNLVYVVGLSINLCREEVLRRNEYFGQFGKIIKISVNKNSPYSSSTSKHGPTGCAYVTFVRPPDALRCIEAINETTWDGRLVRACFGTTKYCNNFLRGTTCTNPDCLYLHEIASEENESFTKEQMLAGYGNTKGTNFFELTHPPIGKLQELNNGSEGHGSEAGDDDGRFNPQHAAMGGIWPGNSKGSGEHGGLLLGAPSGMQAMGSGSIGDGPSWGQVAASGRAPPPPPPQPSAAVEEWPELGSSKPPSGSLPAGKAAAKAAKDGTGKEDLSDASSAAAASAKAASGRAKAGVGSPFLSAAGASQAQQASQPGQKQSSGMLTMSVPNPQGAVSSSSRPGSGISSRTGSAKLSKPPPPGFGASPLPAPARGPPPGFSTPNGSGALGASGDAALDPTAAAGALDNDTLSSLVESLVKKELSPRHLGAHQGAAAAAGGGSEPLLEALQGLELLGGGAPAPAHAHSMGLPLAGIDVWSADVPPAYAGLAAAAYNPLGTSSASLDPSARYLFRHAPSSGAPAAARGSSASSLNGSTDGSENVPQSRFQSRFHFAQEDDPKEGTVDPLWQGSSNSCLPPASDILQLLRQGSAHAKPPPPGFGPPPRPPAGPGAAVPPGTALLQQLQMGALNRGQSAPMPGGVSHAEFMDPAIISSRASAGAQGHQVRPPPGFGSAPEQQAQQQRPPLFARVGESQGQGRHSWDLS